MRCMSFTLLFAVSLVPASAAAVNFQVDFLQLGGQSCFMTFCTDLPSGGIDVGTFWLDQSQLDAGGLFDISGTSNFPNVVPVPATGTGSAAFGAFVAGGVVTDILIDVSWVQFVLEFGNNYSFAANGGLWDHNSSTSGINVKLHRFGTYTISQQVLAPVPEPATVLAGLASAMTALVTCIRRRSAHRIELPLSQ